MAAQAAAKLQNPASMDGNAWQCEDMGEGRKPSNMRLFIWKVVVENIFVFIHGRVFQRHNGVEENTGRCFQITGCSALNFFAKAV